MKRFILLLFSIMCLLIPTYGVVTIEANSFGWTDGDMENKSFFVIPGNPDISESDAEFREYAEYISRALITLGGTPSFNRDEADLIVLATYGIYDESYIEHVPRPVYGNTGISAIRATSTKNYDGSVTTNYTVQNTQGVVGYVDREHYVNQYRRALNVYAYANRENFPMEWKVNLNSVGTISNLRDIIPIMSYALYLQLHSQKNMGKSVTHRINSTEDAYILFLQNDIDRLRKVSEEQVISYMKKSNPAGFFIRTDVYIYKIIFTPTYTKVFYAAPHTEYNIKPHKNYIEYNNTKFYAYDCDGLPWGESSWVSSGDTWEVYFPSIPTSVPYFNIGKKGFHGEFENIKNPRYRRSAIVENKNRYNEKNTENGHEYVDLGLSVKWATCNVGANRPEDDGNYYAWGEVTPKEIYTWKNYKYCDSKNDTIPDFSDNDMLNKYNIDNNRGEVDNKKMLEIKDQVAHQWGGTWRMPTIEECLELINMCKWELTKKNGINGYTIKGPNGNSIFLPHSGTKIFDYHGHHGNTGWYWSCSLDTEESFSAKIILTIPEKSFWEEELNESEPYPGPGAFDSSTSRFTGCTIRPVCDK